MTERVKVFSDLFKKKKPFYEEQYDRKKEEKKWMADRSNFALKLHQPRREESEILTSNKSRS